MYIDDTDTRGAALIPTLNGTPESYFTNFDVNPIIIFWINNTKPICDQLSADIYYRCFISLNNQEPFYRTFWRKWIADIISSEIKTTI